MSQALSVRGEAGAHPSTFIFSHFCLSFSTARHARARWALGCDGTDGEHFGLAGAGGARAAHFLCPASSHTCVRPFSRRSSHPCRGPPCQPPALPELASAQEPRSLPIARPSPCLACLRCEGRTKRGERTSPHPLKGHARRAVPAQGHEGRTLTPSSAWRPHHQGSRRG